MKVFVVFITFFCLFALKADNVTNQMSLNLLEAIQTKDVEQISALWLTPAHMEDLFKNPPKGQPLPPKHIVDQIMLKIKESSKNSTERISQFLHFLKEKNIDLKALKIKSSKGSLKETPQGKMYTFVAISFITNNSDEIKLDLNALSQVKNSWRFAPEFPKEAFLITKDGKRQILGFLPKEKSIKDTMKTMVDVSSTSSGSAKAMMITAACCVEGYYKEFNDLSEKDKNQNSGFFGLQWNKLIEQGLNPQELKLKEIKDISKTEVIATYSSSTHTLSGPLKKEHGRWLFSMGKVKVTVNKALD